MQKIYCYVDENGQETNGRIFVVAVVVLGEDPQVIAAQCEELERVSGKGKFKWGRAEQKLRLDYLRRAFKSPDLQGRLCYAAFQETRAYEDATIDTIARAIRYMVSTDDYTAVIYIDGLSKSKRHVYGAQLRKSGIATHKIQGVTKDENNPLVRLADSIAGFVRDARDGEGSEISGLFQQAISSGALVEV